MLVFRGRDPQIRDKWMTLVFLAHQVCGRLTELSYLVMLVLDGLELKARRPGRHRKTVTLIITPWLSGAAGCTDEGEIEGQDPEDSKELPLNRTTLRYVSARWKAVDVAIDRFCGNIGLSRNRLFELVLGRGKVSRSVVEQVRPFLDPRAVADRDHVLRIHQALDTIWRQSGKVQ
jgi:hypothetical protein